MLQSAQAEDADGGATVRMKHNSVGGRGFRTGCCSTTINYYVSRIFGLFFFSRGCLAGHGDVTRMLCYKTAYKEVPMLMSITR